MLFARIMLCDKSIYPFIYFPLSIVMVGNRHVSAIDVHELITARVIVLNRIRV